MHFAREVVGSGSDSDLIVALAHVRYSAHSGSPGALSPWATFKSYAGDRKPLFGTPGNPVAAAIWEVTCADWRGQVPLQPSLGVRRVTNGFNVIAVRVEDKRCIVMGVPLAPRSRRSIADAPSSQRRGEERIDFDT